NRPYDSSTPKKSSSPARACSRPRQLSCKSKVTKAKTSHLTAATSPKPPSRSLSRPALQRNPFDFAPDKSFTTCIILTMQHLKLITAFLLTLLFGCAQTTAQELPPVTTPAQHVLIVVMDG